jgi:hypothetical protein
VYLETNRAEIIEELEYEEEMEYEELDDDDDEEVEEEEELWPRELANGQSQELSRFRVQPVHDQCPYCCTPIDFAVDCSVDKQRYIEDCPVCCRPIELSVHVYGSSPHLNLCRADE